MVLDQNSISAFREDGATVLRGVFSAEWIETLRRGVGHNMDTPGPYTRGYTKEGAPGHFFGDYCNWSRIEEYRSFFFDSPAAEIAVRGTAPAAGTDVRLLGSDARLSWSPADFGAVVNLPEGAGAGAAARAIAFREA